MFHLNLCRISSISGSKRDLASTPSLGMQRMQRKNAAGFPERCKCIQKHQELQYRITWLYFSTSLGMLILRQFRNSLLNNFNAKDNASIKSIEDRHSFLASRGFFFSLSLSLYTLYIYTIYIRISVYQPT